MQDTAAFLPLKQSGRNGCTRRKRVQLTTLVMVPQKWKHRHRLWGLMVYEQVWFQVAVFHVRIQESIVVKRE